MAINFQGYTLPISKTADDALDRLEAIKKTVGVSRETEAVAPTETVAPEVKKEVKKIPPKILEKSPSEKTGGRKVGVYLRLDPKVIAFFKETGPGWQPRINKLLLAYVEARPQDDVKLGTMEKDGSVANTGGPEQ